MNYAMDYAMNYAMNYAMDYPMDYPMKKMLFLRFMSSGTSFRKNAAKQSAAATKKQKDASGDSRLQKIKSMLYDKRLEPERIEGQFKPTSQSPVNCETADSDDAMTDAVERVWCLLKKKEAVDQQLQLNSKFMAMRDAMNELQRIDKRLFDGCNSTQDSMQLFPTNLRIPTETPPNK